MFGLIAALLLAPASPVLATPADAVPTAQGTDFSAAKNKKKSKTRKVKKERYMRAVPSR
jgi:hypothetical protein